jgi:hypothetical protein
MPNKYLLPVSWTMASIGEKVDLAVKDGVLQGAIMYAKDKSGTTSQVHQCQARFADED